ncbi:MAG TPA: LamG domain-containing protein [Clostridia bacterium]|nr:LamG domain-containing protein [Clostridia bacterium]
MRRKTFWKTQCLAAGVLLAGLCVAPRAEGAANLAIFEFNEGPNSQTTTSKDGNLVGALGRAIDPANHPVLSPDSPSMQANDRAVQLNGAGFLVVNDSPNPLMGVQTNAFTIETWVRWDYFIETHTLGGFVGYGGTYKLGWMEGKIVFTAFGVLDIASGLDLPADGAWHHIAAAWQPGVGVTFYLDGLATTVEFTGTFQAPLNNYLTIGGERLDNPFTGSLDRLRIHKKFLSAAELDGVAASPRAPLAETVVAYDFNETALPCQNSLPVARPAISSEDYLAAVTSPTFSNDTPSGLANDYSLGFTSRTYIQAPDLNNVISLDTTSPSFTLEAWVKFGTQPQDRSVLFGFNGPGGAFSLSVTAQRKVFVTTYGIADTASQATLPDDGLWHHIGVVYEHGEGEMRFYVDGVMGDTVAYAGGVIFTRTDTTLVIGAEPGLWRNYAGLMDRVRISSGALSANQLDYLAVPGVIPGAPSITTALIQQISWPTLPAGYKLQSSPSLDPASAVWSIVPTTPYTIGTNFTVYVPVTGNKMFYRLIKQ